MEYLDMQLLEGIIWSGTMNWNSEALQVLLTCHTFDFSIFGPFCTLHGTSD